MLRWYHKLLIALQEIICLVLAGELGGLISLYINGVYRIVALIVLAILWANIARAVFIVKRPTSAYDTAPVSSLRNLWDTTLQVISLRSTRKHQ